MVGFSSSTQDPDVVKFCAEGSFSKKNWTVDLSVVIDWLVIMDENKSLSNLEVFSSNVNVLDQVHVLRWIPYISLFLVCYK